MCRTPVSLTVLFCAVCVYIYIYLNIIHAEINDFGRLLLLLFFYIVACGVSAEDISKEFSQWRPLRKYFPVYFFFSPPIGFPLVSTKSTKENYKKKKKLVTSPLARNTFNGGRGRGGIEFYSRVYRALIIRSG